MGAWKPILLSQVTILDYGHLPTALKNSQPLSKPGKKINPIVGGDFTSSLGTSDTRSVAQALGLFS